ncbi:MAG: SDR family oxidoreductase [Thermosynechococcaceae cyanobacterium]
MKVLVVGATGTLGRQIVRHAIDEGYNVACLVRNLRKAAFLKEWGASLIQGDLSKPDTIAPALQGVDAVIDAATTRPTDPISTRIVDWDGKVALIQAAETAAIKRFIFMSIMGSQKYAHVPLMDLKSCTEDFLAETKLDYTVLKPSGFFQGLIGQYAIPILDGQAVWVMGQGSAIAYMDTQDIAKFAVKALKQPALSRKTFDLAGPKAWTPRSIIQLCENISGEEAKTLTLPISVLRIAQRIARFFEWGWNTADRLAFTEVVVASDPLDAPMEETYKAFDIDPNKIATLEGYMQDYFGRILKKLRELDYEKNKKSSRKRTPFKAPRSS